MPQKNPLGNGNADELSNQGLAAASDDPDEGAVLALEDLLQPENAAGSPAAALAPRIDCTNFRRVRRKSE